MAEFIAPISGFSKMNIKTQDNAPDVRNSMKESFTASMEDENLSPQSRQLK